MGSAKFNMTLDLHDIEHLRQDLMRCASTCVSLELHDIEHLRQDLHDFALAQGPECHNLHDIGLA